MFEMQIDELENELTAANKRLIRIDEADKRLAAAPKPHAVSFDPKPAVKEAQPASDSAAPAKQ